jgi:hypothetical protein
MLFGLGRNTSIVCPDRLWQSLSHTDREAFLAHEAAHYRRRDHWVRWLEWIVTALYWWCPLVYIARQQLERHEESACDAWAIASLRTPPRSYAEALLNVVDFLSETKVGVPRLASRMQATDTLEERLRLIMTTQPMISPRVHQAVLVVGALLVLIHPSLAMRGKAAVVASRTSQNVLTGDETPLSERGLIADAELATAPQSVGSLKSLPPAPRGWWNTHPEATYANLRVGERDLQVLAEVGVGLRLQSGNGVAHVFDTESVCALAYIASSGRLVIGNEKGELHLWDADSAQSVSLIGKHPSTISSVAYHPQGGLVSGDGDGILSKWDLQSGELLNSISLDARISSVRWARAGNLLAVVTGDWTDNADEASLRIYSGRNFQLLTTVAISSDIAVVQQHEQLGWLAVHWSGQVFSLVSAEQVLSIPKPDVTGLVLCQDFFDAAMRSQQNTAKATRTTELETILPIESMQ